MMGVSAETTRSMQVLAEGLQFPEGPVALSDGTFLVVEIKRGTLTRVFEGGKTEIVAELGGGPNGAAVGPDGAIYVANNGGFIWREEGDLIIPIGEAPPEYTGGRIERVDLNTGASSVLYTECDGQPLRGPNDLVFDKHGGFWFTDTGKGSPTGQEHGAIYYATSDGGSIKRVHFPLWTPNGIGLSPDGSTLYVAETVTGRLWAWDVTGPGEVARGAGHGSGARLIGSPAGLHFFDSLGVEAIGNVAVASVFRGAIVVIAPDGTVVEEVEVPDAFVTNVCFGGPEMQTAYATLSSTGRLVALDWSRPGLRLNY
jgi:gluconolactonase